MFSRANPVTFLQRTCRRSALRSCARGAKDVRRLLGFEATAVFVCNRWPIAAQQPRTRGGAGSARLLAREPLVVRDPAGAAGKRQVVRAGGICEGNGTEWSVGGKCQ